MSTRKPTSKRKHEITGKRRIPDLGIDFVLEGGVNINWHKTYWESKLTPRQREEIFSALNEYARRASTYISVSETREGLEKFSECVNFLCERFPTGTIQMEGVLGGIKDGALDLIKESLGTKAWEDLSSATPPVSITSRKIPLAFPHELLALKNAVDAAKQGFLPKPEDKGGRPKNPALDDLLKKLDLLFIKEGVKSAETRKKRIDTVCQSLPEKIRPNAIGKDALRKRTSSAIKKSQKA